MKARANQHKFLTSRWSVAIPVIIGLSVIAIMLHHKAKTENLRDIWHSIDFTPTVWVCVALSFMCMAGRDFGMSWRFRALTDRQLTWWQAWKVDFLCEFTSCVTPSAVGGSSLGMVFLNTQGIEFGRATTLMMTTLFLDELFFVLACPVIVLSTPAEWLFASTGSVFSHGLKFTFWIVYAVLALWTFILFMGIIARPGWMRAMLAKVTSWKLLKRFQSKAIQLGDNMVATAAELRTKPFRFWVEVFCGTALSWTSRFLVVNALFLGFVPAADPHQWIIFAREFVIWVVLMVSPTPGGSGLSEWIFTEYYGDLVSGAGLVLILALFWRLVSYYVYLVIGAIIVPGWMRNSLGGNLKNA